MYVVSLEGTGVGGKRSDISNTPVQNDETARR